MKKQKTVDLVELHNDVKEIKEILLPQIKVDIASLKVKSSIWGGLSGTISSAILGIYLLITHNGR